MCLGIFAETLICHWMPRGGYVIDVSVLIIEICYTCVSVSKLFGKSKCNISM